MAGLDVARGNGRWMARMAGGIALAVALGSCGSGGVSPSSDPEIPFAISPATATVYSGVPVTFTISGGGLRGPYSLSSSNASVLPLPSTSLNATELTITPLPVTTVTNVTLTARDQAGKTATATATVTPNLVAGDITVTGTAPPGATPDETAQCQQAGVVCAGQSGRVSVTLSQAAGPAPNRAVRFDVVQGDYSFAVNQAQTQFAQSLTVTSDANGRAEAIIRANTNANFQVAIIRATDVATGAFRASSFIIRNSSQFAVTPQAVAVTGSLLNECPGSTVDYLIFGGTPPYTIRNTAPSTHTITPTVTTATSPNRFTTTFPNLACGTEGYSVLYTVTDATGLTTQATLTNRPGTGTPPPTLTVTPGIVTLLCGGQAQVIATVTNAGATTPAITAAVTTGTTSGFPALTTLVPTGSNVITITRLNSGTLVGVPAQIVVGAGNAPPQSITVSTPQTCP